MLFMYFFKKGPLCDLQQVDACSSEQINNLYIIKLILSQAYYRHNNEKATLNCKNKDSFKASSFVLIMFPKLMRQFHTQKTNMALLSEKVLLCSRSHDRLTAELRCDTWQTQKSNTKDVSAKKNTNPACWCSHDMSFVYQFSRKAAMPLCLKNNDMSVDYFNKP